MAVVFVNKSGWGCSSVGYLEYAYEVDSPTSQPRRVEQVVCESPFIVEGDFKEGSTVNIVLKDVSGNVGMFGVIDISNNSMIRINVKRKILDYKQILNKCQQI